MKRDAELTIEEQTLIKLLFRKKNISNEVFNSIDYNLLVKIATASSKAHSITLKTNVSYLYEGIL